MIERLNSFLLYIYNIQPVYLIDCGPELEFTIKRALKDNLINIVNGIIYPNVHTKKYLLTL